MGNIHITEKRWEELPIHTSIYQAEDGTIFYWKQTFPQRLYVKVDGIEIDAALPVSGLYCVSEHGNDLYFCSNQRKVYKAVLSPYFSSTLIITVAHVRDELGGEVFVRDCAGRGICRQMRDGKQYASRLWEDPIRDAVQIDVSEDDLNGLKLLGIHRGKVYFYSQNRDLTQRPRKAHKLGVNVFLIEGCNHSTNVAMYAMDISPVIHISISNLHDFYTLDTETMHFREQLMFASWAHRAPFVDYICGVHNGQITIMGIPFHCKWNTEEDLPERRLITAPLPMSWAMKKFIKRNVEKIVEKSGTQSTPEKDKIIEELVDNVEKLQADLRENSSTSREGPSCVICFDNAPNIIFFDCMHVAVCEECFKAASRNSSLKNCPNCRKVIKKSSKVFF